MCIPETSVSAVRMPPPASRETLFPPQQQLLDARFLESRDHWLICAATGSGKTRMAEWAIEDTLKTGLRAGYIAPLRAIVEEKSSTWQTRFGAETVGLFTGRRTPGEDSPDPQDERLLLFTPEKLASYLQGWRRHLAWLSQLDLLVIDEFHLLGDKSRGATIECLLNRLQRINPFVRFIGLSGTLSNHGEIASWLDARVFTSSWRPIPLEHRTRHFKRATDKPELLLEEARDTLAQGGKVLAFVNSRRRAEYLARFLQDAGINADFSHAGLDSGTRVATHDRMRDGATDVLVATSTVEMGVNFPARKVVIVDSWSFDGDAFAPISVQRYQQFAGRAGRPGLDTRGECVLFAPTWDGRVTAYATATPEPVKSGLFSTDNLLREILYEVAGRLSVSERHLETNFASRTLWRHQGGQNTLRHFVQNLVVDELIKERDKGDVTYLSCTPLGRVATQMLVSPRTVILLANLLRQIPDATDFDLLLAACLSPEGTPKLGFNFEEIDALTDTVLSVESTLLDGEPDRVRQLHLGLTDRALLSAVKCASLLRRHTVAESLEDLAIQFDCYPADLVTLRNNMVWVLEAAQRVFAVMLDAAHKADAVQADESPDKRPIAPIERRCERLRLKLEYGLPEHALRLVELPQVGPRRAQRLYLHGIVQVTQVATLPPAELAEIIHCGPKLAELIQTAARATRVPVSSRADTSTPNLTAPAPNLSDARSNERATEIAGTISESPQAGPKGEAHAGPSNGPQAASDLIGGPLHSPQPARRSTLLNGWPEGIDPYRLRRALELQVTHASPEVVHVSGGAEPHAVTISEDARRDRSYVCDCVDFAKGNRQCKHILRARLALRDDRDLRPLLDRLSDRTRKPLRHSLADLWLKVGRHYDAFNDRKSEWVAPRATTITTAAIRQRR
jgi:helicase